MKKFLIGLSIIGVLASCESKKASEPFPHYLTTDVEWISYEGILLSENGQEIEAVLHLIPGTPGLDSHYRLLESLILPHDSRIAMGTKSTGTYSVLIGSPGQHIIQLKDRNLISSVMRGKTFATADRVTKDLFLKSDGDHRLVLVDENLKEVGPRYTLVRRSELFTVEGYFTVYSDTSEYYERNTQKKWPVAQLASYDEAVSKYHSFASEESEGIYLKALSYTVRHIDTTGVEYDALVFKKILKMDSTGGLYYP